MTDNLSDDDHRKLKILQQLQLPKKRRNLQGLVTPEQERGLEILKEPEDWPVVIPYIYDGSPNRTDGKTWVEGMPSKGSGFSKDKE